MKKVGSWGNGLTHRSPPQVPPAGHTLGTTGGRRSLPTSTSRATQGSLSRRGSARCSASPVASSRSTWAHSASVVLTMDEMDPTLTVLEHAKEAAQQKYLYALKDSVTNVEFTAHLIALQQQQSTMSAVDDSCLQHECLKEDQKESTASTPSTARRRQRIALARFVKKIKRRAEEEDSARAEASRTPDTSGADINPAAEGWRTWNSSKTSGSADLIDLPTWLDQRRDRAKKYEGLGYTNTVSSFCGVASLGATSSAQRGGGVPTTHQQ